VDGEAHKENAMAAGARFAKWGLGLFIFGVFLTFGIIAHYCSGARWPTGELFMQNISLWWGVSVDIVRCRRSGRRTWDGSARAHMHARSARVTEQCRR
jgi:hypothetical protein